MADIAKPIEGDVALGSIQVRRVGVALGVYRRGYCTSGPVIGREWLTLVIRR